MSVIGYVIAFVVIALLIGLTVYGISEEVPRYCPFCGAPDNDEHHWCDGKIAALRESQKNLYDHTKGNHRVRHGQKIMLINQCNCGRVGRVDILVDAKHRGDTKEVFLQGYTCEACKAAI